MHEPSGGGVAAMVASVWAGGVSDAVVFATVLGLFAGAAALGWRRRWLRDAQGTKQQHEGNQR